MTAYKYKAIDDKGKKSQGRIDADNPQDIEQRLNKMGLELINYSTDNNSSGLALFKKGINRKDIIDFTFHMEQLIKAGVPILNALSDLRDSCPHHSKLKEVTSGLVEDIESGKTFSQALLTYDKIFSSIYISTVQVGEESGQLHQVLAELTEMLEWQEDLASQAKKMAIYPVVVLTVVLGVMTFLMIMVVPDLISFIKSTGTEIPIQTKALIATSHFFVNYWYTIIIGIVAIVMFFIIGPKKSAVIRYHIDKIQLKIPLFGDISTKLKIARFTNYFSLMYAAGITVLETLDMSKTIVNNVVMEEAIDLARKQISEGENISNSFSNVGMFPPFVVRMMSVGETSGALDTSLSNISKFYTKEAKNAIEKIEPVLVPLLTLLMAGLLIWIMLSVLCPIFDVISKIGAG